MNLMELFIIAVGLSMDAFAVSICKGFSIRQTGMGKCLTVGLYFGGFQMFMPLLGYLAATRFASMIESFDHWVAFVLLALIGIKMIKESREAPDGTEKSPDTLGFKSMIPLAFATSVDAMAAGISFAVLPDVSIFSAVSLIGMTTLVLSAAGVKIGNVFGVKYKGKAELSGGAILVVMGARILLSHTIMA